jgi:hypothetical protein
MKIKAIFLICILFVTNDICAQEQLFLIKATPFEDPYEFFSELPAVLLKFDADSMTLKEEIELAAFNDRVQEIRYYHDEKCIIISKINRQLENYLAVISTKEYPDSLMLNKNLCPESYNYLNYNLLNVDKKTVICIECVNINKEKYKYLNGKYVYETVYKELTANDYRNIILSGTLFNIENNDYQDVYTEESNGNFKIPVVRNIEERPVFPLALPDSLQFREKQSKMILIHNKNHFVLRDSWTTYTKEKIGETGLIIFDYITQQWYRQKIKGNYQNIHSYGSWLAGVVYDDIGIDKKYYKESPGKEDRKKLNSENTFNADTKFTYFNIYSPGILYLFNTSTKKYIEWHTNQGDNEILLVENDYVYYRVNDELYKAAIINGEKLGEVELLIKDKQVLDIHWAFTVFPH